MPTTTVRETHNYELLAQSEKGKLVAEALAAGRTLTSIGPLGEAAPLLRSSTNEKTGEIHLLFGRVLQGEDAERHHRAIGELSATDQQKMNLAIDGEEIDKRLI
jgi:hypothetical protein